MFLISKPIWRILYWFNWVFLLFFWFRGSADLFISGIPAFTIALGRLAGLSAAYTILLQFFFMGRAPWLERIFGLDTLSRLHHTNGRRGFFLLLLHPVLLLFGYGALTGLGVWGQLVTFLANSDELVLAATALFLFLVVAVTSLYIQNRFRYESWYFVHLLAYLAIFGSFFHQIKLGGTITTSIVFYWYWIALYAIVFGHHILFRFIRPVYNFYRHQFYVSRVERENYNTVSVYIGGRDLETFHIYPGQFMIVRFFAKHLWSQAHPFSLSIIPEGKELRVTIKELGDFTREVAANIRIGTKILIDGPYGIFNELFSISPKVLFIAGGIGITPVRSLMERLLQKGKDAVLLYANRAEQDIVFRDELQNVSEKYSTQVTHILSDEPNFTGERGRVDKEKLQRLVPDLLSREVFLCGPPPMMEGVIKTLQELGVSLTQIHYERFSL